MKHRDENLGEGIGYETMLRFNTDYTFHQLSKNLASIDLEETTLFGVPVCDMEGDLFVIANEVLNESV